MTRAVCFDLDGVLVDSFEAWLVGTNDVAKRLGFPPITRAALEAGFGQGVADDVRTFYPGADPDVIRAEYDALMPKNVAHMTVNPQARETLVWLREAGIGRAIVTNTQQSLAEQILTAHGLADEVDVAMGVAAGRREKPAPDLIDHALIALECGKTRAFLVGDTDYDERAASAAGVPFCLYEMRSGASLLDAVRAMVTATLGP